MVHIFIYFLISANKEDRKWNGIDIKRGQLVTSSKTITEKTGLTSQQIRTCLEKLIISKEITKESNRHYTIITVCKYEDYQASNSTQEEDETPVIVPVVETPEEVDEIVSEEVVEGTQEEPVEYFPVEDFVVEEKPKTPDLLFPAEPEIVKEKLVQFKNSKYSDKVLFFNKFSIKEFTGVNLEYYYNSVYDWSETKNVKRGDNGWIATARNWMRRDIAEGKAKMLNKPTGGYNMSNDDFTDFLKKY